MQVMGSKVRVVPTWSTSLGIIRSYRGEGGVGNQRQQTLQLVQAPVIVHSPGGISNQTGKGIKYAVLPSRVLAMPGCRTDCSELQQRRVGNLTPSSTLEEGRQGCQLSPTIRKTPDFEPFLPVSRLESEISQIIPEVCHFLQIQLSDNEISNILCCLSYFTVNFESFLTNSDMPYFVI